MADRTAAALFARIFKHLASGDDLDPVDLWKETRGYDFHPSQMGVDDVLVEFGLAWYCEPNEEHYYRFVNYHPDDVCDECGKAKP